MVEAVCVRARLGGTSEERKATREVNERAAMRRKRKRNNVLQALAYTQGTHTHTHTHTKFARAYVPMDIRTRTYRLSRSAPSSD